MSPETAQNLLMTLCPALAALGAVPQNDVLLDACEYAYRQGITGQAEAAGPAPAMSRLAGVRPGDLAGTQDCARLWLR